MSTLEQIIPSLAHLQQAMIAERLKIMQELGIGQRLKEQDTLLTSTKSGAGNKRKRVGRKTNDEDDEDWDVDEEDDEEGTERGTKATATGSRRSKRVQGLTPDGGQLPDRHSTLEDGEYDDEEGGGGRRRSAGDRYAAGAAEDLEHRGDHFISAVVAETAVIKYFVEQVRSISVLLCVQRCVPVASGMGILAAVV